MSLGGTVLNTCRDHGEKLIPGTMRCQKVAIGEGIVSVVVRSLRTEGVMERRR